MMLCFTLISKADESRLDSIKTSVMQFLVKVEGYYFYEDIHEFPNVLIKSNVTRIPITQSPYGIYIFEPFSEHGHTHILLVDNK